MNRIVWDAASGKTHVLANGSRSWLSRAGGGVGGARRADDPNERAMAGAYVRTRDELERAGWLTPDTVYRVVDRGPHLKRMQIEVALRCNLKCSYCYSMSGPMQKARLEADTIRRLIREADAMGVLTIDFTGGELLLDRDWLDHVRLVRSYGMDCTVHTNGTLISEADATALAELGVSSVQVSLDSHLAEVHDAARGRRGALARTLRGLDTLRDHGLPIRLSVMAHRDNLDTLEATIRFMSERYPTATINVDRVVATGGALECDNGLTAETFWQFLAPLLSTNVRSGRVCDSPSIEDFEPACGVAYSYVYVTAQGEIAACPTMTSRENVSFTGPHVDEASLAEAWHDSAFFNSFRYTNCENVTVCPSGSSCGGGCRSNAYVELGYVSAPDLVACNQNKNGTPVFVDFARRYQRGQFDVVTA